MPIALPIAFSLRSNFGQTLLCLRKRALLHIQREDPPQSERGAHHEITIAEDQPKIV